MPVALESMGGDYIPDIPKESEVKEKIMQILEEPLVTKKVWILCFT